ncbi:MAG: alpha/beta hydrolase [Streptosporangiaceae bacterium]
MRALMLGLVMLLGSVVPLNTATAQAAAAPAAAVTKVAAPKKKTVAYGRSAKQKFDIYWTKSNKARPAVVLVHGGYWWGGDRSQMRTQGRAFAKRGYVTFAISYRLSTQAVWPAQRNDVGSAITRIRANAKKWGVDRSRIVVVGSSAGGQLATMEGVYGRGLSHVRGIVALSPVNSPLRGYTEGGRMDADGLTKNLRRSIIQLLGCTPFPYDTDCWPRLLDATPEQHASVGDAPMLIIHSAADFVGPEHSMSLKAALKSHGVPVTLVSIPGHLHGIEMMKNKNVSARVLAWIAKLVKPAARKK